MKKIFKWRKIIVFILLMFGLLLATNRLDNKLSSTTTALIIPKPSITNLIQTDNFRRQTKRDLYKVVKVIDGDTIQVKINGKTETLRLIGINSPEIADTRKPVQCFGVKASNKAKKILTDRSVFLEKDMTQDNQDKYGRLLRYVFLEDETNFNQLMISEGYAYEYTYSIPYKYQAEFMQAEEEARENKKGLWADDACRNITPNRK